MQLLLIIAILYFSATSQNYKHTQRVFTQYASRFSKNLKIHVNMFKKKCEKNKKLI